MLQWLRGVVVAVTWLDGGHGRWWLWQLRSRHRGSGGRAVSCCGGCVVWQSRSWSQSWSHGLMMAVAGDGSGSRGRVIEVAAIVSRRVAVAA